MKVVYCNMINETINILKYLSFIFLIILYLKIFEIFDF